MGTGTEVGGREPCGCRGDPTTDLGRASRRQLHGADPQRPQQMWLEGWGWGGASGGFISIFFNAGGLGLILGLGRFPGEGNGYPLQYSCLENTHEQRSLVGYSLKGCKESDMTEQVTLSLFIIYLAELGL